MKTTYTAPGKCNPLNYNMLRTLFPSSLQKTERSTGFRVSLPNSFIAQRPRTREAPANAGRTNPDGFGDQRPPQPVPINANNRQISATAIARGFDVPSGTRPACSRALGDRPRSRVASRPRQSRSQTNNAPAPSRSQTTTKAQAWYPASSEAAPESGRNLAHARSAGPPAAAPSSRIAPPTV